MRRKGRVVQIITEAKKRNGDKVFLTTWKKLPGRGATNPRKRKTGPKIRMS